MKALILGICGQDGSYLADILLEKGYEVHGLYRQSSVPNTGRIAHCRERIARLWPGDITDLNCLANVIKAVRPDELYNEADQDHVGYSRLCSGYSFRVTAEAVDGLLGIIQEVSPHSRIFQPVSSTIFGDCPPKQNERSPLNPLSPYACAKAAALHISRYYRRCRGLYVSCGILYNHDSPRRSKRYLLQEIVAKVGRARDTGTIFLGDPAMVVDIGYAREYMEAAWRILQQDRPDDYILASTRPFTIEELARYAVKGLDRPVMITADPDFPRNGPRCTLVGDCRKAEEAFGYAPRVNALMLLDMLSKGTDGNECGNHRV